jgi:hypothetical protein
MARNKIAFAMITLSRGIFHFNVRWRRGRERYAGGTPPPNVLPDICKTLHRRGKYEFMFLG